jgi:hypothetical protein
MATLLLSPRTVLTTSHTTKLLAPSVSTLLPAAHLAVLAAKNDDPSAKAVIAATLNEADDGFGPARAVDTADVLDQANKMQVRATFVHYWLFGEGAALVAGTA